MSTAAQTFEVASVKPSGPGTGEPTQYRYTSATLENLIVTAFDIQYFQVASKTPVDRDSFDVVAKVPPSATKEQFRIMLQNLLAERFPLKTHGEKRASPAGRPTSREFRGTRGWKAGTASGMSARIVCRLPKIVGALHVPGDAPIVDETGLKGAYSFTLEYTYPTGTAQGPVETPPAPSIFSALQEQLGLRLVSKRLPFEVLAIDSFNRVPAEN